MSDDATPPPATLERPVPNGTPVNVVTWFGPARARVVRDMGPTVLVELTEAATGHAPRERLDVPRRRVTRAGA